MYQPRMKFFQALFLSSSVLLSINASAQQERSVAGVNNREEAPKVGLRVLKVEFATPADEAGLQFMDLISKYGNYQIVDASSYFAAREAYAKAPDSKVEMVYWHNGERVATWVKPGRL